MNRLLISVLPLVLSVLFFSCTSIIYDTAYPTLSDGKYDSEFPYRGSSDQLEEIMSSVKLINSVANYKSYNFNPEANLKLSDLNNSSIQKFALTETFYQSTASGSATVIYSNGAAAALITCAHIIDFPDTVIAYTPESFYDSIKIVLSISIKQSQVNYIPGIRTVEPVKILSMDKSIDAALLTLRATEEDVPVIKPLGYPKGHAKDLEWGSFVYVFGYPLNYKMVSKAIVSSPNMDRKGSFLVDAVFNKGFSGGIVMAIKDGVPNFELVGMVKWLPAEYEDVLKPKKRKNDEEYSPLLPYTGEIFVQREMEIKYGIARIIPVEVLNEFVESNYKLLLDRGLVPEKLPQ